MMLKVILGALLLSSAVFAEKARYDNYRVYTLNVETKAQLEVLQAIEEYPDGYRFYESPTRTGVHVNLIVPPHKLADFGDLIVRLEFKSKLISNNFQEILDNEQPKVMPKSNFGWDAYYPGANIIGWFDGLVAANPSIMSRTKYGESFEGRDLLAYRISYKSGNPAVFLEAQMHAREWISIASISWIVNELLTSTDPEIRDIAENFDWFIVPIANPDGYEFTWTNDRLWRKTRSPNGVTGLCFGVDPNRNWGFNWMQGGASSIACSDTFAGPVAFSEPETRDMANFYRTIANQVTVFISVHAFGQMLLVPYGHTTDRLDNYDEAVAIGQLAINRLTARFGTEYTLGNIAETIYIASGSSMDWVKGDQRTHLTYTYELRDLGANGFTLPADQIIPTSQETMDSLIVILQQSRLARHN